MQKKVIPTFYYHQVSVSAKVVQMQWARHMETARKSVEYTSARRKMMCQKWGKGKKEHADPEDKKRKRCVLPKTIRPAIHIPIWKNPPHRGGGGEIRGRGKNAQA